MMNYNNNNRLDHYTNNTNNINSHDELQQQQ